jgi:hypothetical protein
MTSFFAGTSPQTPVVKIYEIIWLPVINKKLPPKKTGESSSIVITASNI